MNKQGILMELKHRVYKNKNVDLYNMDKQELISEFVEDAIWKAYNQGWKDAKKKYGARKND